MNAEFYCAVAAGAALTFAFVLAAMRMRSFRRVAGKATARWSSTSMHTSVVTVAGILAIAGVTAARAISENEWRDLAFPLASVDRQDPQELTRLLASAPGFEQAPGMGRGSGADIKVVDASVEKASAERAKRALQSLREFVGRIEKKRSERLAIESGHSSAALAGSLPDVDTMIGRLRDRLNAQPSDIKGWMMLGWASLNTGKLQEAIAAYETALKLDANNQEIKLALEDARQKTAAPSKPLQ